MNTMGYIDRTLKILSRLHPDWAGKLLFPFGKEITSLKPVRLELDLPERRVDDAYEIILKNGEKKYIFLEFLFGEDRRAFADYFVKTAMANSVYGSGKAATLVIQITEGKGTKLEPLFKIEIENIKNEFRMQLLHLNQYVKRIENGELYEFAPLLPLLKGGANEKTLENVKELIEKEKDSRMRADLYSVAITMAGRYLNKDFLWKFFKEEIEMIKDSLIVQDWIDEGIEKGIEKGIKKGIEKGELKRAERDVIEVLEARFDLIHKETFRALQNVKEIKSLEMLLKKAIKVDSLNEFNEILKKVED